MPNITNKRVGSFGLSWNGESKLNDVANGTSRSRFVDTASTSGIVVGKLAPDATITRAETATVLLRLLQKAELIDVRTEA